MSDENLSELTREHRSGFPLQLWCQLKPPIYFRSQWPRRLLGDMPAWCVKVMFDWRKSPAFCFSRTDTDLLLLIWTPSLPVSTLPFMKLLKPSTASAKAVVLASKYCSNLREFESCCVTAFEDEFRICFRSGDYPGDCTPSDHEPHVTPQFSAERHNALGADLLRANARRRKSLAGKTCRIFSSKFPPPKIVNLMCNWLKHSTLLSRSFTGT
jgi:hypothetical protein